MDILKVKCKMLHQDKLSTSSSVAVVNTVPMSVEMEDTQVVDTELAEMHPAAEVVDSSVCSLLTQPTAEKSYSVLVLEAAEATV